jgi:hypothetical protein
MGKPSNSHRQSRARGLRHTSCRGRSGAARRGWSLAALALIAALPQRARADTPPSTPPQVSPPGEAHTQRIRRALLIEYLKDPARAAPVERYMPAVLGTVFLATSVGLAAADFNEEISVRQRWATVGLVGALAGLSFSAYLAPDRARRPLLSSVSAMAVAGGGAAFYGSDEATSATRFTFGSMMLTGAIMEGLVLVDAAMRPAPSARQLERHRQRLESSTSLSDDDLRAAEAELVLRPTRSNRFDCSLWELGFAKRAASRRPH